MNNNADTTAPLMTFMMGLPAAGKSRYRKNNLVGLVIDPDEVKEGHADYDPKNPAPLHAWSKSVTDAMFRDALANPAGHVIVDGTGTNSDKMVRTIREASAAGYRTRLVFVKCSLETSLRRNALRARNVPEHIVIEKAGDISTSFEIVSAMAPLDQILIVSND